MLNSVGQWAFSLVICQSAMLGHWVAPDGRSMPWVGGEREDRKTQRENFYAFLAILASGCLEVLTSKNRLWSILLAYLSNFRAKGFVRTRITENQNHPRTFIKEKVFWWFLKAFRWKSHGVLAYCVRVQDRWAEPFAKGAKVGGPASRHPKELRDEAVFFLFPTNCFCCWGKKLELVWDICVGISKWCKKVLVRTRRHKDARCLGTNLFATYTIFWVGAHLWAVWSASSSEEQHTVVNVGMNCFSSL